MRPECLIKLFPYALAAGCQHGADFSAETQQLIPCFQTQSFPSTGTVLKHAEITKRQVVMLVNGTRKLLLFFPETLRRLTLF